MRFKKKKHKIIGKKLSKIIDIIFDSNRSILTTKHIELIKQWKTANGGSISNFDDLSKIDGIDRKIVENLREFCASKMANDIQILDNCSSMEHPDYSNDFVENGNNFIIYDERIPPTGSNLKRSKPIKLALEPKFDWNRKIQSFTSIHQESNGVSIARFSTNNSNWNEIDVDTWTQYKMERFGIKNLCQLCEKLVMIVDQLPQSDIYIVDDHIRAQRYHKSVTSKKLTEIIQINQQCAILMALLYKKVPCKENDKSNIFFMGYQAVGQLFNLLVKNESISTQSTIKNLLRGNFCGETLKPFETLKINIYDELKQAYHKSNAVERECLGRSMLIGFTFMRLGILKAKTMAS